MINIVLAINDNFVGQASALIMSIYKNSKKDSELRINILHSDVTKKHQDIIKDMVKDMETISELNFIDMKQFVSNKTLDKFMHGTALAHLTPESYYRLFTPTIFPQYDRILYLDSDLIVCEDLTKLYNTNIDDLYVAAVSESQYFFKSTLMLNNKKIKAEDYLINKLNIHNKSYFNTGVMLLNLDKMREDNIQEKSITFLSKNYPLACCDQCVLNAILNGKVKFLDQKYNIFYSHFPGKNISISIFHFAGSHKPWNYYKKNLGFDLYWKYFKLTPFYNKKQEKLYLKYKKGLPKNKFIKIVLGKHRYRIKIFHRTFSINPSLYRRSKKKLLSLLCISK